MDFYKPVLDEIFAATSTYTNENTIYSSAGKVESTVLGLLLNTLNDNIQIYLYYL